MLRKIQRYIKPALNTIAVARFGGFFLGGKSPKTLDLAIVLWSLSKPFVAGLVIDDTDKQRRFWRNLQWLIVCIWLIWQFIEPGKLTKVFHGRIVVGLSGLPLRLVAPETDSTSINGDRCLPLIARPSYADAFIFIARAAMLLGVLAVLAARSKTKVFAAIVKAIAIYVVNQLRWRGIKNKSVHPNGAPLAINEHIRVGIKHIATNSTAPRITGNKIIVGIINDCVFTQAIFAAQRNQFCHAPSRFVLEFRPYISSISWVAANA